MAELEARTGVVRATIHHYARQGLLPPPQKVAANRFLYDERHVRAVRVIRLLRDEQDLSLEVIGELLPQLLEDGETAFHDGLWTGAVGTHLRRIASRSPAARLLQAAVEGFSRSGYGETNVDELCRAAGMAKGSFYRHFNSKEELFFAAARDIAGTLGHALVPVTHARGELDPDATAATFVEQLAPRLPILLDLLSGALQQRPGYAAVVREALDRFLTVGQRRLETVGAGPGAARRVLARALVLVLADVEDAPGVQRVPGA